MTSAWLGQKVLIKDLPENWEHLTKEEVCPMQFYGANLVERIHPVPGRDSSPCVSSGIGLWKNTIYHFLPDKPPSSNGDEIYTEFFVDFDDFPSVAEKIYRLSPLFTDFIQITELRPVAKDTIPMSPTKNRDSMGIHWTWKHDFDNLLEPIFQLQQILEEYDYRPHYGKFFHPIFSRDAQMFPEDWKKLQTMIESFNHEGKQNPFVNCFVERFIFGKHSCS